MKTKFTWLIALILCVSVQLNAQFDFARFNNLYGRSNLGTEFLVSIPPAISSGDPTAAEYVKIFMTSLETANVRISIPQYGYSQSITVNPGAPQVLAIPIKFAQPLIQTATENPGMDNIFPNKAIKISADYPIGAYVIVDYAETKEGFLAYPVNVLGKKYTVASYDDPSQFYPGLKLNSNVTIVGAYDGTNVEFTLGGNSFTKTTEGLVPGQTRQVQLNRGDVWVVSSVNNGSDLSSSADLSGSVISSDKPVAVIAGSRSANIPFDTKFRGYITEMMIPDYSLGSEFLVPRIAGRTYSAIVRIFAKDPNTTVYAQGQKIGVLNNTPGVKGSAYLEYRPDQSLGNISYTISADKPVSVVVYNTGFEDDKAPYKEVAPFEMVLAPISLMQKEIIFTVPKSSDNEFKTDYLVVAVKTDASGKISDSLSLGYYQGINYTTKKVKDFQPVTSDMLTDFSGENTYRLLTIALPQSKGYTLNSDSSFSAYLYGFGSKTAYGYPASLEFGDLASVDADPPEVHWALACNGDVTGTAEDMPDDETVRSNLASVIFDAPASKNYSKRFDESITPGVTRKINWKLKIDNSLQDGEAYLIFRDMAGNFKNVIINYIAPKISMSPAYEDFGALKQGDVVIKDFTIYNNSDSVYTLSKVQLQDEHKGFEIIGFNGETIEIPGKGSFTFQVKFIAGESGKFTDSLGFGNDCFIRYFSELSAIVGSPVIQVSDVDFGGVTIGDSVTQEFTIKNRGTVDLFIKSFSGPDNKKFGFVEKPDINAQKILKLAPNDVVTYKVYFKPTTEENISDEIVFSSDAKGTDSIAYINARAVKPGLVAESFDWKSRRIHRSNFPAGPYQVLNDHNSIRLTNTGSNPIKLLDVEVVDSLQSDAFSYSSAALSGSTIDPGRSLSFPVEFRPLTTGEHRLVLKYIDDKGGNATTVLHGVGVVPKIESTVYDFDTTLVHDDNSPNAVSINIHNLGYEEWEYADTLNVYDMRSLVDGEISDSGSKFGTKGFRYDREKVELPMHLLPGQSYSFKMEFSATSEDLNSAQLSVISDALNTGLQTLNGWGISRNFTVFNSSVTTCFETPGVAITGVKNFSNQSITFAPVTFDTPDPDFTIPDHEPTEGFTLPPNSSKMFSVVYTPSQKKDKTVGLIFRDKNNPDYYKVASIEGKTNIYEAATTLSPDRQTKDILSDAEISYLFHPDYDPYEKPITNLELSISYNRNMLVPNMDKITIGDALRGIFEIYEKVKEDDGSITVKLHSLAGSVITEGELLKMSFKVYFPNDTTRFSAIKVKVTGSDNSCVEVEDANGIINMDPYCAQNMRLLDFSSSDYGIKSVQPNPASDNNIIIDYSIAFDGNTTLEMVNSMGLTVRKPVSTELKAGEYELTIDATTLASGIYFVRLTSGFYTETRKVVISK